MSAAPDSKVCLSAPQNPTPTTTRVLHVTSSLNAGGVETWLLRLARLHPGFLSGGAVTDDALSGDNCSGSAGTAHAAAGPPLVSAILVLGETDGSLAPEFRRLGVTVVRLPYRRLRLLGHTGSARLWALYRFLRQTGPWDVVHSHVFRHSLLVQLAAFACRVPLRITHSHHCASDTDERGWSRRRLVNTGAGWFLRQLSDEIVACSSAAASSLFGPGAGSRYPFLSLPCGVDQQSLSTHIPARDALSLRSREGIPADALVLGHVGRFVAEKGHERLLRAAALALRSQPGLYFLLIGDGPLRPAMETLALSLGIHKRVQFAGNRHDIPRLLQGAMDGFVFPSLREGLGVAVIEAQAAGLPCLLSGAIPEEANLFPKRNRCYAPDADASSLAEALLHFARSLPPLTVESPSDAPPSLPAGYRLDHNAQVLASLYQRVHPIPQPCPEVHRHEQPA